MISASELFQVGHHFLDICQELLFGKMNGQFMILYETVIGQVDQPGCPGKNLPLPIEKGEKPVIRLQIEQQTGISLIQPIELQGNGKPFFRSTHTLGRFQDADDFSHRSCIFPGCFNQVNDPDLDNPLGKSDQLGQMGPPAAHQACLSLPTLSQMHTITELQARHISVRDHILLCFTVQFSDDESIFHTSICSLADQFRFQSRHPPARDEKQIVVQAPDQNQSENGKHDGEADFYTTWHAETRSPFRKPQDDGLHSGTKVLNADTFPNQLVSFLGIAKSERPSGFGCMSRDTAPSLYRGVRLRLAPVRTDPYS